MHYATAISLVILYYNCLLTLDDEVCLTFLYFLPYCLLLRSALFGQGPLPCQKECITLIDIYPFSLLLI